MARERINKTNMASRMEAPPGFKCLVIKFDKTCKFGHTLFYKPNQTRTEDTSKPKLRTLLVLNVPPYCNKESLSRIFSLKFGDVENVILQKKITNDATEFVQKPTVKDLSLDDEKYFKSEDVKGFKLAFVIFSDPASVTRAAEYETNEKPCIISTRACPVKVGMGKWIEEYCDSIPDKNLQVNIDLYMSKYDTAHTRAEEKEEETKDAPDEEGWIKVSRKGKHPVVPRTEANELKAKSREKMKRKQKELINVYAYQIRESKREKIAELRRKFEEDKVRIQSMRQSRKFQPF